MLIYFVYKKNLNGLIRLQLRYKINILQSHRLRIYGSVFNPMQASNYQRNLKILLNLSSHHNAKVNHQTFLPSNCKFINHQIFLLLLLNSFLFLNRNTLLNNSCPMLNKQASLQLILNSFLLLNCNAPTPIPHHLLLNNTISLLKYNTFPLLNTCLLLNRQTFLRNALLPLNCTTPPICNQTFLLLNIISQLNHHTFPLFNNTYPMLNKQAFLLLLLNSFLLLILQLNCNAPALKHKTFPVPRFPVLNHNVFCLINSYNTFHPLNCPFPCVIRPQIIYETVKQKSCIQAHQQSEKN